MIAVIDDIVTSFTDRLSSHRSAWPRMQKCLLNSINIKTTIAFNDEKAVLNSNWLVSTPMEFKGDVFNLFGGYTEEVKNRIARVLDCDLKNIRSLDTPIANIETILRPRSSKTDYDFTELEWQKIKNLRHCTVIKHEDLLESIDKVVLGDSHSISRYSENTLVERHDGMTMHGLLQKKIISYLPYTYTPKLIINVGNIDIRHHLLRQLNPVESVKLLVKDLKSQLNNAKANGLIGAYEITLPYPIEFEGRRIPKTGYYKGTAFYGSWQDRNAIRNVMEEELRSNFDNIFAWPQSWYEMDPEEYAKTYMEKPGSIHLSPEFYEWDLINNAPNVKLGIYV